LTFLPGARPSEYLWTIFSVRVCGFAGAALSEAPDDSSSDAKASWGVAPAAYALRAV
jgi:hypothetical protein